VKKGFSYFLITIAAIALQARAQGPRATFSEVICSTQTAKYDLDLKHKELKISTLTNGKWLLNDFVKISRLEKHIVETQPITTEYVFNLDRKVYKISASFRGEKLNGIGELSYGDGSASNFGEDCQRVVAKPEHQTKR
jgi:hypothetical protein